MVDKAQRRRDAIQAEREYERRGLLWRLKCISQKVDELLEKVVRRFRGDEEQYGTLLTFPAPRSGTLAVDSPLPSRARAGGPKVQARGNRPDPHTVPAQSREKD